MNERLQSGDRIPGNIIALLQDGAGATANRLLCRFKAAHRAFHLLSQEIAEDVLRGETCRTHGRRLFVDEQRLVFGHWRLAGIMNRIRNGLEAVKRGVQNDAVVGELLEKTYLPTRRSDHGLIVLAQLVVDKFREIAS